MRSACSSSSRSPCSALRKYVECRPGLTRRDDMDFYSAAAGNELGTFALGLVIAGVVGGLVAGMLGVGGGIVIVPVLYHVLALMGVDPDVRMHIAVGTSLATIIPTSFSSARSHNAKGAVDWDLLRRWVVPMVVGVLI